uniref:LOB domain-containing protein n=1 Tax=Schistocephalus solidus TaxID=70667 RepID=A0A183TR67_SCHSO
LVDLFAQAVVEKALEVERARQCALRQSLEEICKAQRVRRIRSQPPVAPVHSILVGVIYNPLLRCSTALNAVWVGIPKGYAEEEWAINSCWETSNQVLPQRVSLLQGSCLKVHAPQYCEQSQG